MIARFEELDFQRTPMGDLTLRRRVEPSTGVDVFEVKLGEEFLMSSLFVVAEEELARLGLAAHDDPRDVMVGGLGLGYTAVAALADARVTQLTVVETMPAVIDWHERKLLPASTALVDDPRTTLLLADFFAMARAEPSRKWDAILVDIDHSTVHQLDPSHADLYTVDGLRSLARHLREGGVFALWSDDPPEPAFVEFLKTVFANVESHVVPFDNFLTGGVSTNTVYVAGGVGSLI
jgi:spermidine synthase